MLDLSVLMQDPDFARQVILRRVVSSVSQYGETVLTAQTDRTISASVQALSAERLAQLPEGSRLSDSIEVYSAERLITKTETEYADRIVVDDVVYEAHDRDDNLSLGAYNVAICVRVGNA